MTEKGNAGHEHVCPHRQTTKAEITIPQLRKLEENWKTCEVQCEVKKKGQGQINETCCIRVKDSINVSEGCHLSQCY